MTVWLFCHVLKTPSFFFPKAHSVACKLGPKFMFFGIGYKSYIFGGLGSVWRSNLGSFGVRDGAPGCPKLVFFLVWGAFDCFCYFQVVAGAAFGRYLESLLRILRYLLWMILTRYLCLCAVQMLLIWMLSLNSGVRTFCHPHFPGSISCQYVCLFWLLCLSWVFLSSVRFACLLACLIVCGCVRARALA